MAQQHRNQQEQENQRSRWREGNYGDRNEEDRTREWASGGSGQSGRRGFGEFSRGGESEQSGWGRESDDDRWFQGGESRYQQSEGYGRGGERYGGGQQGYGSSGQSRQGGYERTQYGQRDQGGYGGGQSYEREGFRGEQHRSYGEFREPGRSASLEWHPEESSRGRPYYGRQYESQSFDQPYPQGFQEGSSQRATRYGSGRGGYTGSGSHYGKGPKGYTRSDDRLKEVVCEKLTDDPMIDASDISVEVTSQVVKLTGTVDDRATKYEVEELVERCGGVKDIDNQLRVRSGSSQGSPMRSQGGSTEATAGSYGSGTGQTTSQSAREGSSGTKTKQ
jgi:osmotically-inducible protein OsmY